MIYKYNDELPPDIVEKYNAAISDFIKTYPNRVQVSMRENDNVVITLLYGYERGNISSILREIAIRCRGSLVDDVFRMDIPSCKIVYANTSILRFAGDLNAILEDIPTLSDKLEVYKKPIVSKLPSEVNLPQTFNTDVETIVNVGETFKAQNVSASKQESMGIATQIIGNKEHTIINPKTVEKYANSHINDEFGISLNNAVQTIVKTFTNSPSITTTKITEKLESAGLKLERLNKNVIMLGKVIEKSEDKEKSETGADEYKIEYEKIPYKSPIIFHYGNPVISYVDPSQYEVELIDGSENVAKYTNETDGSQHIIDIPFMTLWNKKDNTCVGIEWLFNWIRPEEYANNNLWWNQTSDTKFTGDDGNEYEDTPYNRIIHNPNVSEKEMVFNHAKEKYLTNAIMKHLKNISTDYKVLINGNQLNLLSDYKRLNYQIVENLKYVLEHNEDEHIVKLIDYLRKCATSYYPERTGEIANMSNIEFANNLYYDYKYESGHWLVMSSSGFFDPKNDTILAFSDGATFMSTLQTGGTLSRVAGDIKSG